MEKIVNIQFLRAIAAIQVVFFHTADHYFAAGGNASGNLFTFFQQYGYSGVDLFFVISGYVIWSSTKKLSGLNGAANFAYKRAARIYLGYWPFFFFLLLITAFFFKAGLSKIDILGSFLLTQTNLGKLLLSVSWTLTFELYFYICFMGLFFCKRRHIPLFLFFASLFIITVQAWGIFHENVYSIYTFHAASLIYKFYTSPFCLEFIAGCYIALYFEKRRIKYVTPLWAAAFLFLALGLYYQNHIIHNSLARGYYYPQRVFIFGSMAICTLASLVEIEKRGVAILPKLSLMVGDASYTIYLSHTILLLLICISGIRNTIAEWGCFQGVLMSIIILCIVVYSILHYRWIDTWLLEKSETFREWIRKGISPIGFNVKTP